MNNFRAAKKLIYVVSLNRGVYSLNNLKLPETQTHSFSNNPVNVLAEASAAAYVVEEFFGGMDVDFVDGIGGVNVDGSCVDFGVDYEARYGSDMDTSESESSAEEMDCRQTVDYELISKIKEGMIAANQCRSNAFDLKYQPAVGIKLKTTDAAMDPTCLDVFNAKLHDEMISNRFMEFILVNCKLVFLMGSFLLERFEALDPALKYALQASNTSNRAHEVFSICFL